MVEFCPECSGVLKKKTMGAKSFLACACGYQREWNSNKKDAEQDIQKKKSALEKKLIVVSDDSKVAIHPITITLCPKCGHTEAESWQEQTRSADEPSTSFFRCVKCKHTWREY